MSTQALTGLTQRLHNWSEQSRVLRVEKPAEAEDLRGESERDPDAEANARKSPPCEPSQNATVARAPSWHVTALSASFAAQVIGQALSFEPAFMDSAQKAYGRAAPAPLRMFDTRI